jgi:23S rRNA-/tRNA-specific pseudouridylate synthase
LVGDRKYSENEDDCEIALWSHRIEFTHPVTKERMVFQKQPPQIFPWDQL